MLQSDTRTILGLSFNNPTNYYQKAYRMMPCMRAKLKYFKKNAKSKLTSYKRLRKSTTKAPYKHGRIGMRWT